MTLLVRDEEDIIRDTVRFHLLKGVDFIIAMDNRSVDGTPDILREFEKEGVLLHLRQDADNYDQGRWVTSMARMAAQEHGADWVINSDADEFWWPLRGDLKAALCGIGPEHDALRATRTDFPPREGEAEWFAERMQIREVRSFNNLGLPLPPKMCHRASTDVVVHQGNHNVSFGQREPSVAPKWPIVIFHFPVRTLSQIENKISNGGSAYSRNRELPAQVGSTWRALYEMQQEKGLESFFEKKLLGDSGAARGISEGTHVAERRLFVYLKPAA